MFEDELAETGLPHGFRDFKKLFLVIAGASLVLALLELFFLTLPFEYLALAFFVTLVFPSLLFYFYLEFLRERKQKEIEAFLPQALMQIASFPKRASMEKIFSSIAESGYGALGKEFALARNQVKAGSSVPKALKAMDERNSSRLLKHATALIAEAYASGADMTTAFKDVAEDVLELQAISREASSSATLQKYTLLFGGAALVPLILGLLLSVVASLEFGGADLTAFGSAAPAQHDEIKNAVVLGTQAYLVIFSILASWFIASLEGNARKAVLYLAFMLPTALVLFTLARSANII